MSSTCFLKINNAWIADGSGTELRRGSVLVDYHGRVVALDSTAVGAAAADECVDARGKIVSPGFIDAHSHSDMSLPAAPEGFSRVSQGVTTEISGNCGLSAFPITARNREHLEQLYANYHQPITAVDFASYREFLASKNPTVNLIPLVGHNTLRAAVVGYETEKLSAAQSREMRELLRAQLRQSAPGLSTGLLYVPGCFADSDEITDLMRVLAEENKIYTTHLRSEGEHLLESLEETVACAIESGLKKLHISHFKTAKTENFGKLDAALAILDEARRAGIRVTCDRYPYTRSMTQLSAVLPSPWDKMDDVALQKKLAAAEERLALAAALRESRTLEYWKQTLLVSTACHEYAWGQGRSIFELNSENPQLAVAEMLAADATGTTASFAGMSYENMLRIIQLPFCMAGSDGNAFPADYSLGRAHPRAFGTMPRFLRLLLESNMPMEQAVHKVTGLPARTFELPDCGFLSVGATADLVVFEPDELDADEDFTRPHTPARGIYLTVKSGKIVYHN